MRLVRFPEVAAGRIAGFVISFMELRYWGRAQKGKIEAWRR
jgi:hypothetical protein